MDVKQIISEIFNGNTDDITSLYDKITHEIPDNKKAELNKQIKDKLQELDKSNINRVILIGSILNYTGSSSLDLTSYYCSFLEKRISISQYNFLIRTIFNDNPPLSSDTIFDIAEYTYLDSKVVGRKINELTDNLKQFSNPKIILFLLILFFRNDLRNENYKIIYNVLINIGGNKIKGLLNNNKIVKDFLTEIKPQKPKPPKKSTPKPSPKREDKIKEKEISKDSQAGKPVVLESKPKKSEGRKKLLLIGLVFLVIIITSISLLITIKHKKTKLSIKTSTSVKINEKQKVQQNKISSKSSIKSPENKATGGLTNGKISTKESQSREKTKSSTSQIKNKRNEVEEYIIKKGDTLSEIAKKYYGKGYYYKHLADVNRIKNPDLIYPGTKIVVPQDTGNKNNNNQ